MKPERKLLRRIAALPAGEKLPLSRFAREFNCSTAVVVGMIHQLVADGDLHAQTLRPLSLEQATAPVPPQFVASAPHAGQLLFDRVVAEDKRRGLSIMATSLAVFQHKCRIYTLRDHEPRAPTVKRLEAWIADAPGGTKEGARPQEEGEPGSSPTSGSPTVVLPDNPTGNDLVDAIEQAARDLGIALHDFIQPLVKDVGKLGQMRIAQRPYAATIERVKALLSGAPVPAKMRTAPAPVPQQFVRRADREDLGLPPSQRELSENVALDEAARKRARVESLRDLNETRHHQHDCNLREVTLRESEARAARRHQAGRLTTARPLDVSDVLADAQLDRIDTASDRRARELDDLASPSSVLRRAQRDWPDQCAKVKALAAELGLTLAEAWHRVIGAGIECLNDPEAA